jgi:hypothetical protein
LKVGIGSLQCGQHWVVEEEKNGGKNKTSVEAGRVSYTHKLAPTCTTVGFNPQRRHLSGDEV